MAHSQRLSQFFGGSKSKTIIIDEVQKIPELLNEVHQEEVQQERLTRNLAAFSRFMETATFSQAQLLNVSEVAREWFIERKVVEDYFLILEDLLMSIGYPFFLKKQKESSLHIKSFFILMLVFLEV